MTSRIGQRGIVVSIYDIAQKKVSDVLFQTSIQNNISNEISYKKKNECRKRSFIPFQPSNHFQGNSSGKVQYLDTCIGSFTRGFE